MVRILGLEFASAALTVRVIVALSSALLVFVLFYLIPSSISAISSRYFPSSVRPEAPALVASLVSPVIPAIGLGLTAVVFAGVLLRGTRAYGIALVLNGLLFAAYTYAVMHGGTVVVTLPHGLPQETSGDVSIEASPLMALLLFPSLLTVVKGLAVLATQRLSPPPTRTSRP